MFRFAVGNVSSIDAGAAALLAKLGFAHGIVRDLPCVPLGSAPLSGGSVIISAFSKLSHMKTFVQLREFKSRVQEHYLRTLHFFSQE